MADEVKPTPGVDAPVGGTPTPVDAGAKLAGTPTPAAVDAAGKQGKVYDEAYVRQLIADRDNARKNAEASFLGSERGKKLLSDAAEHGKFVLAEKERAEKEAIARGEHEKVIAEKSARIRELEDREVASTRMGRESLLRREFESKYRAAGGFDPGDAQVELEKALRDGVITVDEAGQVSGVAALIKKIADARPRWFNSNAQQVLAQMGDGVVSAAAQALDDRGPPEDEQFDGGIPSLSRPPRSWWKTFRDFATGK
jgi:hypothetical protein